MDENHALSRQHDPALDSFRGSCCATSSSTIAGWSCRCVCMLQPAKTTIDGVSYMASCRTAMSRGQRRVFESHARQIEQDDLFVSGVLTAQSCEKLLHYDVEPNASSDIMIVSDIDLPSKPSSKYIVTSHSLQPESSAQSSPKPESILCTAHALLETAT